MKKRATIFALLLLIVSPAKAQHQQSLKQNAKRDFPDLQLIRPSIPPQHYNFELRRWEREKLFDMPEVPAIIRATPIRPEGIGDRKPLNNGNFKKRSAPRNRRSGRSHRTRTGDMK